ncbi:DsbA family oxidoreductase [Burkholderia oklahomensis]|uniref:DsbA family oxidoreductase n=1 Tax=Burkholderia oklahomensis TaxID=342113 RepID=UPI00264E8D62|nr:DsbA family oxidoreductase [Burkholderia oklahomensis]MDN7673124.1 DsbA family oxidoreductase [Burkholderia oklahomensis]
MTGVARNRSSRDHGDATPLHTLTIECWFDFVCPWCWIGKRHLETAIDVLRALRPDVAPEIVWHPYRLLPDTPRSGLSCDAFHRARLSGPDAVAARRAQAQRTGRTAGIEFAFDRIRSMPNTYAAHALVSAAMACAASVDHGALVERLFIAYFVEGRDIGDVATLERIAIESGMPSEMLPLRIDGRPDRSDRRFGHAHGDIAGVPAFRFGGQEALSGAQPSAVLLQAMLRSLDA